MSKYDPLGEYLADSDFDEVPMTFAEIERVLGFSLPAKSKQIRAWWSNNSDNSVLTKVWLDAGFRSEQVDVAAGKLVFRRIKSRAAGFAEEPSRKYGKAAARPALFGWMKGSFTVTPGTDLTAPADPRWAELADAAAEPDRTGRK